MSRKVRTVATFHARIDIPVGGNISQMEQLLRQSVWSILDAHYDIKMQAEIEDRVVVKLVKKETFYS